MADGVKKPFKFSRELQSAIQDDFKRQVRRLYRRRARRARLSIAAPGGVADSIATAPQAIDSAKKRAVAQRVDYDTFKNMVRRISAAAAPPRHGCRADTLATTTLCRC
jgi:hypothetical protein